MNGFACCLAHLNLSELTLAANTGGDWSCAVWLLGLGALVAIGYGAGRIAEYLRIRAQASLDQIKAERASIAEEKQALSEARKRLGEHEDAVKVLARQKSEGFPWLAQAYADYEYLIQMKQAGFLDTKKHPAHSSAEKVREIARERRCVEQKLRISLGIIEYWTSLFPFLLDWLGEDVDDDLLKRLLSKNVQEPIHEAPDLDVDPVRVILRLSQEDYDKLSPAERNQRALETYLARPKSKWEIGRAFERYVGYTYEIRGYKVYYQGILEGYEDLGRDVIAVRPEITHVVQCKFWSSHKQIHEKHVNQLFGTSVMYKIEHQSENVVPVLVTSTCLSDRAKQFASYLQVTFYEEISLPDYPCVKCNISLRSGERIYHLPFDQQYDRTVIEPERGECFAWSATEAEESGFRRAWRWRGAAGQ
jgi:hypothetical protein